MRGFILFVVLCPLINVSFSQNTIQEDTTDLSELSIAELMDMEVFAASRKFQKFIQVPAIISLVTRADIMNLGARTLIDILKQQTGIETYMSVDGEFKVAIRGVEKDGNILLMINGQQINDFYDGKAIYDISADIIERVEIIRGPGSALYGTNAMVGIINVITLKEDFLSVNAGHTGMYQISAGKNFYSSNYDLDVFTSFNHNSAAPALILKDKNSDQIWSLTHEDEVFTTNRFNNDFIFGTKLEANNFHFQLFNFYRNRGSYLGPLYSATTGSDIIQNRAIGYLSYDYNINSVTVLSPKLYGNFNYNDSKSQEYPDGYISSVSGDVFPNGRITEESYVGTNYGFELDVYMKASDRFDIITGSVFEDLRLRNYVVKRNYDVITETYYSVMGDYNDLSLNQKGASRFVFAYFIQGSYSGEKLDLNVGMRYDDYSDFGFSFNPRIGSIYHLSKNFRLKATVETAFRAPTFKELYDNTLIGNEIGVKGNEALKPENIQMLDLGFEWNRSQFLLKYNAYFFANTGLIRVYDPHGGGSIGEYENIGRTENFGHEAELITTLTKWLSFTVNYSHYFNYFYWDPEHVGNSSVVYLNQKEHYHRELRNLPSVRVNTGLILRYKKFSATLTSNFGNSVENNNRFYLESYHYARIPMYAQGNFVVQYFINEKTNLAFSAFNIGSKYSAPDESTNIDALGIKGLKQPGEMFTFGFNYFF